MRESLILWGLCLAVILVPAIQASTFADQPKSKQKTNPPSLDELAKPWNSEGDVPWQVAEILGTTSKAAYLDAKDARTEFRKIGFDNVTSVVAGSMVLYVLTKVRLTVLVFRGTDDLDDWLVNLKVKSRKVDGGYIHTGFYDAYQTLRSKLRAALKDADPEHLWITGHSLGGALAVVCAHDLGQAKIDVDGVVTFGQPMVAKKDLARFLSQRLSKHYARFVNNADIVPRIPPPYSHFGSLVWFRPGGVSRSKGNAADVTNEHDDADRRPSGPPPLTQEEFRDLQRRIREARADRTDPRPVLEKLEFPPIDDHGMDRYLEQIKRRGVPDSSKKPSLPPLPRPPLIPKPPSLPKIE